jgi:hypothetical protein
MQSHQYGSLSPAQAVMRSRLKLAAGFYALQERLDVIGEIHDGTRMPLLSHSPLRTLHLGRLQLEWPWAGSWRLTGSAAGSLLDFASDQANREDHQQWYQGNQSKYDPILRCHM